jgi:hypothetical protein
VSAGLEIVFADNGDVSYSLQFAKLTAKGIELYEELLKSDNIDFILNKIPKSIPVSIAISGKLILIKKFISTDLTESEILTKIFPNAEKDSFYTQCCDVNNNNHFVGVIRKDSLRKIINTLSEKGNFIVGIYVAPFLIQPFIKYIKQEETEIDIVGYQIETDGSNIVNIKNNTFLPKKKGVFIQNEKVEFESFIPFLAAISYFFNFSNFTNYNLNFLNNEIEEFKFYKWFSLFYKVGLGIILFILLVNFLLFNSYNQYRGELESLLLINKTQLETYDELNKKFNEKHIFLKNTSFDKVSKKSFYADRIASEVPTNIRLIEINIAPIRKHNRELSKFEFDSDIVLIKGKCSESIYLNDWVQKIKTYYWVKDLQIINYKYSSLNLGEFEIKLIIKD